MPRKEQYHGKTWMRVQNPPKWAQDGARENVHPAQAPQVLALG